MSHVGLCAKRENHSHDGLGATESPIVKQLKRFFEEEEDSLPSWLLSAWESRESNERAQKNGVMPVAIMDEMQVGIVNLTIFCFSHNANFIIGTTRFSSHFVRVKPTPLSKLEALIGSSFTPKLSRYELRTKTWTALKPTRIA